MNHEKFAYWKGQSVGIHEIHYSWFIRDRQTKNGMQFHGALKTDLAPANWTCRNTHGFLACGLELHSATPLDYSPNDPPNHLNCRVTGGSCWSDGSTLDASRMLGHINPATDDDAVWSVLHEMYEKRFENKKEVT